MHNKNYQNIWDRCIKCQNIWSRPELTLSFFAFSIKKKKTEAISTEKGSCSWPARRRTWNSKSHALMMNEIHTTWSSQMMVRDRRLWTRVQEVYNFIDLRCTTSVLSLSTGEHVDSTCLHNLPNSWNLIRYSILSVCL